MEKEFTIMEAETVFTISNKSRNLSFGWTNSPTGRNTEIATPGAPRVQGGMATVKHQIAECHRCNSGGTYHNTALFVGGQRIAEIYLPEHDEWCAWRQDSAQVVFDAIENYGSVMVAISDEYDTE